MLSEIGRNAVALGALVLALGLLGWHRRVRVPWAWGLAVSAAVTGGVLGILVPSDAWTLPSATGHDIDVALLLAWAVFAGAARSAGRLRLPGPPMLVAAAAGALLGELGGAALMSAAARDREGAARLALAAAGGGLVGRIGDPALLLAGAEGVPWMLAPLGVACVLVAWPTRAHMSGGEGSWALTGVGAVVAGAGLVPAITLPALVVGAVALLALGRRFDPMPLLWVLAGVALVLMATAAGTPEFMALGMEEVQESLGALVYPALAATGAAMGALTDGPAAALLGEAALDRALSLHLDHAREALAAGIAVGGLGPLVVAGAVRQGLLRWLAQVALGIAWVALVF